MRKRRGRLFGAFMSAVLLTAEIAAVSGIAFGSDTMTAGAAAEPVMRLGTAGIDGGEWIAYGKKADTYAEGTAIYRVLDAEHDNAGGNDAMFVMSEGLWGNGGTWGNVCFDNTRDPYSNVWQGSDAQAWCGGFYTNNFGTAEQTAVRTVTKNDAQETLFGGHLFGASSLIGESVFFLSAREVHDYISDTDSTAAGKALLKARYGTNFGWWWLRSPADVNTTTGGAIDEEGIFNSGVFVYVDFAARPAFNIEKDAVLFSMADGAAKSASSTPAAVGTADSIGSIDNPWQLTLLDDSMSVTPGVSSGFADNDHKILLANCTSAGDSDRISVMITNIEYDENGASILYYGKLGEDKTFTIPEALDLDGWGSDYHIYLIAEKTNTGVASDYASLPTEVNAPGEAPAEPSVPSNNSNNSRSSNNSNGKNNKKTDSSSSKSHKAHVHEYEWVTVSEPTPYADGEYAYRCKECGHVADTAKGDYTAALMNAMKKAIEEAPENGTVKMDCGNYVSLNSSVAAAHDARPDVAAVFTFRYRGDAYEITIPAGVAIVPSLNEEGWAGFMCIKNINGVSIVKK